MLVSKIWWNTWSSLEILNKYKMLTLVIQMICFVCFFIIVIVFIESADIDIADK